MRYRKRGLPKLKQLWSGMAFGNSDYVYESVNLLTAQNDTTANPVRFLSWNAETPQINQGVSPDARPVDENAFLKRVIIKLAVLPQVTKVIQASSGTEVTATSSARVEPFHGALAKDAGLTGLGGYALDGGYDSTVPAGSYGKEEGVPVSWSLLYETYSGAGVALNGGDDPYLPATEFARVKNKREFRRGMVVTSLYNPKTISIDKTFPGRGVRLSLGSRDINQLTLAMWLPDPVNFQNNRMPAVGVYVCEARVLYGLL